MPDPRTFLGHLKIKAGLKPEHWSGGFKAWRFVAEEISDEDLTDPSVLWSMRRTNDDFLPRHSRGRGNPGQPLRRPPWIPGSRDARPGMTMKRVADPVCPVVPARQPLSSGH